jgi:hypothetical protein
MDGTLIFKKTARGAASFSAANGLLTATQRGVLIMLDGKRPLDVVRKLGAVFGDCDAIIEALVNADMIERVVPTSTPESEAVNATPAQLASAKSAAVKHLFGAMGSESDRVCLQIERSKSLVELTAQIGIASAILRDLKGDAAAKHFETLFSNQFA